LIGVVADEVHVHYSTNPLMQDPSSESVITVFGGEAKLSRYRARRPGASSLDLLADLATEEIYHRPTAHLADEMAKRGHIPYVYFLNWSPPTSPFKSCHNIELPFVFGTLDAWGDTPMIAGGDTVQMMDLSTVMREAWISFIRDGVPERRPLRGRGLATIPLHVRPCALVRALASSGIRQGLAKPNIFL
jgi:para-nitrobenzyl esterase